jgi:hypothetical protein
MSRRFIKQAVFQEIRVSTGSVRWRLNPRRHGEARCSEKTAMSKLALRMTRMRRSDRRGTLQICLQMAWVKERFGRIQVSTACRED